MCWNNIFIFLHINICTQVIFNSFRCKSVIPNNIKILKKFNKYREINTSMLKKIWDNMTSSRVYLLLLSDLPIIHKSLVNEQVLSYDTLLKAIFRKFFTYILLWKALTMWLPYCYFITHLSISYTNVRTIEQKKISARNNKLYTKHFKRKLKIISTFWNNFKKAKMII